MGTGTSRGKKVAPATVSEVSVTQTAASPKPDAALFKPLKIRAILRSARNRAQPDCHSEGQESDLSGEDEDGELDTALAGYEEPGERVSVKKAAAKKSFMRSRTYGLCHFGGGGGGGGDAEEEPRVQHSRATDVNKKNKSALTHSEKHTPPSPKQHNSSTQSFLTRGTLFGTVPTSEKQSTFGSCHSSSLTMPVILYDGSEEELMDTIEREFS